MDKYFDEMKIHFCSLENVYIFMKDNRREFNTGYYSIKSLNFIKDIDPKSIFPHDLIMILTVNNDKFPECMKTHTQEEWDAYVKENTK